MASFETLRATGTSVVCLSPVGERDFCMHPWKLTIGPESSGVIPLHYSYPVLGSGTSSSIPSSSQRYVPVCRQRASAQTWNSRVERRPSSARLWPLSQTQWRGHPLPAASLSKF